MTLSIQQVLTRIAEELEDADCDFVASIYNQVCSEPIVYAGDSTFEPAPSNSAESQFESTRTDQQIVDQTNELARLLYAIRGYEVKPGYRFDRATHPHEVEAWNGACEAQRLLTNSDPNDALDNIDD